MSDSVIVPVQICGVEYRISSPIEENEVLIKSAELLDEKLTTMRSESKLSLEQAAILVGLTFASELHHSKNAVERVEFALHERLTQLIGKLDNPHKS